MSRILTILRAGLVALVVLPAATSCDKISALAQKVRGKASTAEAAPSTAALGENLSGGKVHHILEGDYDRLVADPNRLILVDFYADWCPPCRALAPTLATLASENPEKLLVLKVNVDHAQALAARAGVRGIPDIRFFRDGKQIDTVVGATPLEDMRRIVQAHLPANAPAAAPAATPAPAGPLDMVDKLKRAMTKKDEADSAPIAQAAQPPAAPAQPAIQPIKKGDEWMPQGMSKGKPPSQP